ncbi:MAG: hypothetical protein LBN12_06030 [Clostridiales Family XIII bacterium]|jgi:hypothetical protein|nr:hypothetical protein [Clostridiales Family XIII bacterium]
MMDYEELLALLDMEGSTDFVYFEQFAELLESGEDIPLEAILALVQGADNEVLAELTEGYFEDILQFVPDDEVELFTLLQTIGTTLAALAQGEGQSEEGTRTYAEELFKFRNWYTADSRVLSTDREDGVQSEIPLLAALTNYRVRNFVEDEYDYDFSEALDYPLDEYIVSLAALAEDEDPDDDAVTGEEQDFLP